MYKTLVLYKLNLPTPVSTHNVFLTLTSYNLYYMYKDYLIFKLLTRLLVTLSIHSECDIPGVGTHIAETHKKNTIYRIRHRVNHRASMISICKRRDWDTSFMFQYWMPYFGMRS